MDWVLLAVRITVDALRFAHVMTYSEHEAVWKYLDGIPSYVTNVRSYTAWRMTNSPLKEMEDGHQDQAH